MNTYILNNRFFYYFLAITAATAVPAMAQEQLPDSADGTVVIVNSDDGGTETQGDTKKEEEKDTTPPRTSYGYFNFGGSLSHDAANKTTGGIGATVGYYRQGGFVQGNLNGITKDYLSLSGDVHRMGYNFICDDEKKDMMCIRLDASVQGQYGVGTKTGTIGGRAFASPVFKLYAGDHTVIGLGAGIAGGGIYTARLTDDGSAKGTGGVGANALLYVDSKFVNASVSADYLWSLDPSNPITGVANVGGLVAVPVFKKKDKGMSVDLFVNGKVDVASIEKDKMGPKTAWEGAGDAARASTQLTGGIQAAW